MSWHPEVDSEIIVDDEGKEYHGRIGRVMEVRPSDGYCGVELVGPRPLGLLYFASNSLRKHSWETYCEVNQHNPGDPLP